ncbi:Meiotically up-regulated gene 65 protein [Termitomyces sp. T112]|nr:Meiotically up-regulated gene 65 protein [Termitomyces sp. T112]
MSLPPPPCTSRSNDDAANAARKRITAKSRRFAFIPNLKSRPHLKASPSSTQHVTKPVGPSNWISLDSTSLVNSDSLIDKYKWVVVYENQRGITLFSIPYYSRRSLLPFDPPPFTTPNASPSLKHASISLEDYPLPDGTWKWVSKCWMIDMRSDTGEVQHDGFEYNWVFRAHKWSADVGSFSAGGWVRRRRWIRLMMRPARTQKSAASSFSHLVNDARVDVPHNFADIDLGWLKEDVEGNWQKCCLLMKYLGRDGRKLELWKLWLAPHLPDRLSKRRGAMKVKARHSELMRDMTADEGDVSTVFADILEQSQAPLKEYLIPILRLHGSELLHTFVYPESRASFMAMLGEAGLFHVLEAGIGFSANGMDFWSYVDDIAKNARYGSNGVSKSLG